VGIGRVTTLDGRALIGRVPARGTTLRLAANTDALIAVRFPEWPMIPDWPPGLRSTEIQRISVAAAPVSFPRAGNRRGALAPLDRRHTSDAHSELKRG